MEADAGIWHWQKMHLIKVVMAHSGTDYGLNELGIKLQIDLGAHFMCDQLQHKL